METVQLYPRQIPRVETGTNAFGSGGAEAVWIATFTFFITWLLGLLLTPLVAMMQSARSKTPSGPGATGSTEAGAGATTTGQPSRSPWANRLANFTRAARDSFLILLGMTLVNISGHGITGGVITLQWIIFALLMLWTFMHLFMNWGKIWYLEMFLLFVIAVLSIINFSLAWRGREGSTSSAGN